MNDTINKIKEKAKRFWAKNEDEILICAIIFTTAFTAGRMGYIVGYTTGAAEGVVATSQDFIKKFANT